MSRYINLKDAVNVVRNTVAEGTLESTLELRLLDKSLTADVRENVNGRWVEVVDRTEMYDKEGVKTWGMLFQCNQCGFVLNAIEGHTGQYNFCPNCGAEMRGE